MCLNFGQWQFELFKKTESQNLLINPILQENHKDKCVKAKTFPDTLQKNGISEKIISFVVT